MPKAKQKFSLNADNYFNRPADWISNSMISTYLKSKSLYKKMYIDKTVTFKETDPMKLGSIVDDLLTQGKTLYEPKYLKREDPEAFARQKEMDPKYLVTDTIWEKACDLHDAIANSDFWNDSLGTAMMQVPMQGTLNGATVCGMADRIDRSPDDQFKFRLIDLKTVAAQKIASPQKWFYNCQDFGYFRQLAMYRYLWSHLQGIPEENVTCHHAVASYVQEGLVKIALFDIPDAILDVAMKEVEEAIKGIQAGDFEDPQPTWATSYSFNQLEK